MRTTKIAALACTALVLASGLACGKTEDTTTPAASGGVIAESKSSKSDGSTTTAKAGDKTTTTEESDQTDTTEKTTKTTKKTTTTEGSTDETDVSIPDVSIPDGLPGSLEDCLKASQAMQAVSLSISALMSPGASQADIDKLNDQIDDVKASVPDELKADFEVWAKAFGTYATVLGEINANGGMSNPANLDKLQELTKTFDDPAWKAANDNISAYFQKACQ